MTQPKLINYLQGYTHSIDLLLALYAHGDGKWVNWGDVKQSCISSGNPMSDLTYRKRIQDLEDLHLIESRSLDRLKHAYRLNPKGREIARMVSEFIQGLQTPA